MTLNSIQHIQEKEQKKILTLEWFIQRQNEIQKQVEWLENIWNNHQLLLEKILNFQIILKEYFKEDLDPIQYLENLYYKEKLSLDSILLKVNTIYKAVWRTKNFYNSSSALQKFLVYVLNWKLRNAIDNKTTKAYQSRTGEKSIEKTLERKAQRKAEFLSWFIKNSHPQIEHMDYDIFHSFDFKYKKLIYVISNVFHISKENFLELQELNMWNQSLADRFNEQFEEYKIDFSISHKDIARVFEKLQTN